MDLLPSLAVLIFSLACIRWLLGHLRCPNSSRFPLPPGPKGYPIIGNLFDLPTYKAWFTFDHMLKIYGDMVYLNVLGQHFLILGNPKIISDLFEKRSRNYSDRMHSTLLLDLMDLDYSFGLLPYGSRWRDSRRAFQNFFHQKKVKDYLLTQLGSTRTFIRNVLESPDEFSKWIHFSTSSSIMEIVYGTKIKPGDQYLQIVDEALEGASEGVVPGKYLVEFLPIMKYIPSWFPGAGWKRKVLYWRDINRQLRLNPYTLVKNQVNEGTATPSVCRTLIGELPDPSSPDRLSKEHIAINTCAVSLMSEPPVYNTYMTNIDHAIAAAETSLYAARIFFMAMLLYPEAQKKGQAELDKVLIGRLPEHSDSPSLPYINAMVKETLRWNLVVPGSAPHTTTNDDEYNGYFIPKGTLVFGNAWTLLHDPEIYKDPEDYIPDRFLKDGKLDDSIRDPSTAAFGYGRRICPGRYFALNALFLMIAHTLAVFDIKPALDEDGNEIEVKAEMTGGFLSQPVPFRCRIVPRSKAAADLIRSTSDLME